MTGRRPPAPYLLAAFLIGIAMFDLLTLRSGHNWGDDFAQYIHHAKNIALGVDYNRTGYLWNPQFPMLGPATDPPVFPLMLAPVYAGFGLNLMAMKVVGVVSFVLALFLIAKVFGARLGGIYLAALLLLMGWNPYFWHLKDNILSDLPFLLFTYLCLYLIQIHPGPECTRGRRLLFGTALGVSCYLAYGTRSLGGVLLLTLIVTDWLRWRRITGASFVAIPLFAGLALLQSVVTHGEIGYASIFTLNPHRILTNVAEYARYLSGLWNNAWWRHADAVLLFLFGALAAAGFWNRVRSSSIGALEVFAVLYGIAILPWIATQGRYLVPLMPLYVAYALGALEAGRSRAPRRSYAVLATLVLLAGVGFVSEYATAPTARGPEGVGRPDATSMFAAVRRVTDPHAVIAFQKPSALALFTDRRATGVQNAADERVLWDYLNRVGATYAMLGPDDNEFLYQDRIRNLIREHPDRFTTVYSNLDFVLYRIARGSDSHGPS